MLFAAGMSMFDTADGCFMNFAYGWAFAKPVRKIYYNIAVTALSVAVALIIGTVELVSGLVDKLGIDSGPLAWVGALDLDYVGFGIVGRFVVTRIVALLVAARPHRGPVVRPPRLDRVIARSGVSRRAARPRRSAPSARS